MVDTLTNSITALAGTRISSNDLADARNAVLIPFNLHRQTYAAQADEAALWEYRGKGANFAAGFAPRVARVTPEDIARCARTYLMQAVTVVTTPNEALNRLGEFLRSYPEARADDLYKVLYQGVAGPGHLGADKAALRRSLEEEWNAISPESGPLLVPIGIEGDWAWLNLKAWKQQDGTLDTVIDALQASIQGRVARDCRAAVSQEWMRVAAAIAAGALPLKDAAWRTFQARIVRENFPVVHHTPAFMEKYAPAYRVVSMAAWKEITGQEDGDDEDGAEADEPE